MNFDYGDTQQMLLDSAERVIGDRATVEHWRARRSLPDGLDQEAWTQFAELGWLALLVSEDDGGIGGTMEDAALLLTALGKGLSVEPFLSTAILGVSIFDKTGGEQRAALLEQIVAGEIRVALAHAEVGDRYEVATRRNVTARRDGDGFVLEGRKTLVLDGPSANRLIVSASLDGAEDTALFLVEPDAEGIERKNYRLVDGSHASDAVFSQVRLPASALLAGGNSAVSLLEDTIDRAALGVVAEAVGAMEACLEVCSAYIKERKQFGVAIGSFQSLQHLIVDMLIATHQSRSVLYYALAHIDDAPRERMRAVSTAKVVAGEAMQLVSRTGIQLHGGYGLTDEYKISHYFRRLQVLEKAYGDIDYHQRRLST